MINVLALFVQQRIFLIGVYLFFMLSMYSCKHNDPLFQVVFSSTSGITFNNLITENDSINPLVNLNVYNGAGIGIGDFNGDGLPDLYFTGNMVSNRLYINQGNFKFKDVTKESGVGGNRGWGRGVAVVDINNDGLPDIYVCNTLLNDPQKRLNLLFINQGADKTGIPHFKEMAKEYGLDINVHSTMASFFDYDNDGDLDMYLTVNEVSPKDYVTLYRPAIKDGSSPSTGRLYRNDWDPKLHHGVFHDVSKEAGTTIESYGHAATTVDINQDGWKDIYVSSDFVESNILYINNHDGTFTDRSREYFKHTSMGSMGQDIEDINNDGLPDVIELDMNPPDNYRKKMFMGPNNYQQYLNFDKFGYQYQYSRNTLQLNEGKRPASDKDIAQPAFSEISYLSGMSQTDWSWCPLVVDFDNDGFRDLIVTTGFPKDITDHDFMNFRSNSYFTATNKQVLDQIPVVKIPNFAFRNNGKLIFEDVSKAWGFTSASFSNGAVFADLDNDGDMDVIISNIDDEPSVYRNMTRERNSQNSHFLNIRFLGNEKNRDGLGAIADIYYDHGKHQYYENDPFRGYLSSVANTAHFGLGKSQILDSVIVKWQNGYRQKLVHVKSDQMLTVDIRNAAAVIAAKNDGGETKPYFQDVTKFSGIDFKHKEDDKIDFAIQSLLPHKYSGSTPALAVGDIDGNGLDDIVIGGNSQFPAQMFLQQKNGKFIQKQVYQASSSAKNPFIDEIKDEGILLFDADGDGFPDLYIASGGYINKTGSVTYQDRFYLNDGKGNFKYMPDALPVNLTSKFCVRAADINKDGKLDLFISGRVEPGNFPKSVSSVLLRNDSRIGHPKFTDITASAAPSFKNAGMICDALFTDFDDDGWVDLIAVGEWMPIRFFKNFNGKFVDVSAKSGVSDKQGLWTSIAASDIDHDGSIDYVVGNIGLNTYLKASKDYPLYVTAKDFDGNGSFDAIPSMFLKDQDGTLKEFPLNSRDDIIRQMISMRSKFQNYHSFALATMDSLITPAMRNGSIRVMANTLSSAFLKNDGHGRFKMSPLPIQAQFSSLGGMTFSDVDGDGKADLILVGNDYSFEPSIGRSDAFNGLILKSDGNGNFKPVSLQQSGFFVPGDAKALVQLMGTKNHLLIAASQHNGNLKLFAVTHKDFQSVGILPEDQFATISYSNKRTEKREFYYGSSYLSQSGRFILLTKDMTAVSITNFRGVTRRIR